ncbi:MAG: hypothetical protein A3J70_07425 [Elusimicrobia bacterium RIFCSPHIGHO2_02_FULL_61_10]|nr:MAG: hypothetical protein A3J70_07425 [Elusimicrobia bacterium RIFCSPHIGHO2_02_FULL_61_10]
MIVGKGISAYTGASATVSATAEPADTSALPSSVMAAPESPAPDTAAATSRPTISSKDFDRMSQDMRRAVRTFQGGVSIYVKNLETGKEWAYNADEKMPSASLIKLPIMIGVVEKIGKGELSLDHPMVLTREARRSGSGHIKWRPNGEVFTIGQLLEEMMAYSDNIAQELLIRAVGMKYLRERFAAFGLTATNITREGLSLAPRTRIENYTTAREMGMLLEQIYRGQKFGGDSSARMIELMKHAKYNDRLPRQLPAGWTIAHKTGLLRRACHDCGIVYSPAGDYIICVLTRSGRSYRDAKRFISKVAAISYRYFETPTGAVASTSGLPSRAVFKPAS